MELNSLIFPAPESSFNHRSLYDNVIWIPKKKTNDIDTTTNSSSSTNTNSNDNKLKKKDVVDIAIPCLYLPHRIGSDKLLLYFHGNAEDIGWASDFCIALRECLQVNVLSMEYPGYSVYIGKPNAATISQDAEIVYDYLITQMGIKPSNIFLFGRSIGSGPATYLASHRNPGALLLMSPIASIKSAVQEIAGKLAKFAVAERFKNVDEIKKVKCPSYFIHGKADTLVPHKHTIEMMNICEGISDMHLPDDMTHNDFKLMDDIINPISKFFDKCSIKVKVDEKIRIEFPKELYSRPEYTYYLSNKRSMLATIFDKFSN